METVHFAKIIELWLLNGGPPTTRAAATALFFFENVVKPLVSATIFSSNLTIAIKTYAFSSLLLPK
jgi:hypothetical protein